MDNFCKGAVRIDIQEEPDKWDKWVRTTYREAWKMTNSMEEISNIDNEVMIGDTHEDILGELEARYSAPDYCTYIPHGYTRHEGRKYNSRINCILVSKLPTFVGGGTEPEAEYDALLNTVRQLGKVNITRDMYKHLSGVNGWIADWECSASVAKDITFRPPRALKDMGLVLVNARLAKSLNTKVSNLLEKKRIKLEAQKESDRKRLRWEAVVTASKAASANRIDKIAAILQYVRLTISEIIPTFILRAHWRDSTISYHMDEGQYVSTLQDTLKILREIGGGRSKIRNNYWSRKVCYGGGKAMATVRKSICTLAMDRKLYLKAGSNGVPFVISYNTDKDDSKVSLQDIEAFKWFGKWLEGEHAFIKKGGKKR